MKWIPVVMIALLAGSSAQAADPTKPEPIKADWSRQLKADPEYFPFGVWMQEPSKAAKYQQMGINLYVNLWQGPTDEQLAQLADARMDVFCEMEHDAVRNINNPIIVGWLHVDEPDNAQAIIAEDGTKTYGPPITPEAIQAGYQRIKEIDPSRPVMLNLGQGVAWDGWKGRGVRTGKLEDYPKYLRGADMVSFDIYPVVHSNPEIAGKLDYVGRGVARLVKWSAGEKMVWAAIECSRIGNVKVKPTPEQIRSEVWMAIIHGARGIIYFVHQFAPKWDSSPILTDEKMFKGVAALNAEVASLAKVINSPDPHLKVIATSANEKVPIASMTRQVDGAIYIFAVSMGKDKTRASFTVPPVKQGTKVEVLGEKRNVELSGGTISDNFDGYAVHLYKID